MIEWLGQISPATWAGWVFGTITLLVSAFYTRGQKSVAAAFVVAEKARLERENTIANMAKLETKVDIFTEMMREFRAENRALAENARDQINANNTVIRETRDVAAQAVVVGTKAAENAALNYEISNHVNEKIEKMGILAEARAAGLVLSPVTPKKAAVT